MTATDYERMRQFSRRAFVLGGLQLGVFALAAGRLYQLQILNADHYRTLAEDNRINLRLTAPPRGQIFDRFGVPLAINQQNFRIVIDPDRRNDLDVIFDRISTIVPLNDSQRKRVLRDIREARNFSGVLVADNLTWDQVAAIELNAPDLPGIEVQSGEVRTYPYTLTTAHALGYVGPVSEAELEREPLLALPGLRIGKNGVERQHDGALRGRAGSQQLEMNAHGHAVRELSREDPVPGADVTLTIDIGLQQYVQQRLSVEKSAAAVVMDAQTGGVYALASHPTFDPNLFTYGITQKNWDDLMGDERAPLTNKAISGQYAPGSTFKMVTALAALEAGVINEHTPVYCPGHYDLGKHRFHCWKRGGHGTVSLNQAIAGSCDTYFYDISRKVGVDRITAMAKRLGLGQKTGLDMPHERNGFMPTQAWKQARRNEKWQQGETLINAIGQGYVLATPLQLAVMTARMVNGGHAIEPHITKKVQYGADEQTSWPDMGISQRNLKLIFQAMNDVVNTQRGTAYGARIIEEGLAMGGKTGTSQVRRISMAERATGIIKNEDRPWRERDHALFVGYAPIGNPRYAMAVIVEHGGGGGHIAAPIARDILQETQRRNPARG
jgi:penicillin-binding protein 2